MFGSEVTSIPCGVCLKPLNNAHLLPCMHAFCLRCLEDECTQNSRDKFYCPLCIGDAKRSTPSRPWHAYDNYLEAEEVDEARRRRQAEIPASELLSGADMDGGDNDDSDDEEWTPHTAIKPTQTFPCPSHPDRIAESFCGKCRQAGCEKCVSVFHKRCQGVLSLSEAVNKHRDQMDQLHMQMADSLVQYEMSQDLQRDRMDAIEEMRKKVTAEIQSQREALVNLILEKEKLLTDELNSKLDALSSEAESAEKSAGLIVDSISSQLHVLDLSISTGGEGELLGHISGVSSRLLDMPTIHPPDESDVGYKPNDAIATALNPAKLGALKYSGCDEAVSPVNMKGKATLTLTQMIGFHGGCRDDQCDPLLTDLLLLPNGDVILTDRDNKCVKRFNNTGKLLTRVVIEAVPSRIAAVSHSRAVVSAMNKKALYFLSLHGTVRVLSFVRVRKIYSFLASVGRGVLAAGTSQCDAIDLLNDKGELLRQLYAQRPDKALISRPLYLTTAQPYAGIVRHRKNGTTNGSNNNNRRSSTKSTSGDDGSSAVTSDVKIPDLLISDSGKRVVFRLTSDGEVTSTLKSKDSLTLECPLGVTVHGSGQALLVDRDTDCVMQLDEENRFRKKVLTSSDGLSKPCGLYAGHRGQVALSQVDGMIKIYNTTVTYEE